MIAIADAKTLEFFLNNTEQMARISREQVERAMAAMQETVELNKKLQDAEAIWLKMADMASPFNETSSWNHVN